jgi:hypothetical protein
MVTIKPQPVRTLQEYYNECINMLDQQPGDYHIGPAHREIVAMCHKLNRPIQNCVKLLMATARENVRYTGGL